jgi:hypothetical protein
MQHITLPYQFRIYWIILLASISFSLPAQVTKSDKGANIYTGVSPIVLDKDRVEISLTNSFTSFWLAVKKYEPQFDVFRVANRYRFTRFDQALRVSYGFSKSKRWDLGAELRFAHVRLDDAARSSPFRVFGGDTDSGNTYRGISMVGLRARFMPFGGLPELTLQGTAYFPIARQEDSRRQLDAQRAQAGLLATFYQPFNDRTLYFLQADWQTRFQNNENRTTTHSTSLAGYLVFSLFGEEVWRLFPGCTFAATLQSYGGGLNKVNQQLLGSLGLLYQPGEQFGAYFNVLAPFILESGSEYVEWVRPSFSAFSLGLRTML